MEYLYPISPATGFDTIKYVILYTPFKDSCPLIICLKVQAQSDYEVESKTNLLFPRHSFCHARVTVGLLRVYNSLHEAIIVHALLCFAR